MNELVQRVAAKADLDETTAEKAVGIILNFLMKEGSAEKVGELVAKIPGADDVMAKHAYDGAAGGGPMAVMGALQGAGVGMMQVQGVAQELGNYANEIGAGGLLADIASDIPGLSQFL